MLNGLCHCGCGRKTPVASRNRKDLGWKKGEPLKYLRGHNSLFTRGPETPPEMKWCGQCRTVKPRSEFFAAANQVDGLQGRCKQCNSVKTAAYRKANRENTNRHATNSHRRSRLGVSPDEFDALFTKQRGLCAICGKPERVHHKDGVRRALAVDHCHKDGHIRALLCSVCNRGLGLFCDDPDLLERAAAYLRQSRP